MNETYYYNSTIGILRICIRCNKIISLSLVEHPVPAIQNTEIGIAKRVFDWLDLYFAGKKPEVSLPLAPEGTAFQKRVWDRLLKIPYGSYVTYGQIAKELGGFSASGKMSAQAVGQAVGGNPIAILIPCHRVLGCSCQLTGYAYGLERKRKLLDLEKIPYKK